MNPTSSADAGSTPKATPVEIVQELLNDPTNPKVVNRLTTSDVTYVSLNYKDENLRRVMPWCGTYSGPQAIIDTFVRVYAYWEKHDIEIQDIFGDNTRVAIFGRMDYRSTVLQKSVVSPMAIFARVIDGKISYLQYMEDTFATGESFRSSGTFYFKSNPNGEEVAVGDDAA